MMETLKPSGPSLTSLDTVPQSLAYANSIVDRDSLAAPLLRSTSGVFAKSSQQLTLRILNQPSGCPVALCDDVQPLRAVITLDKPAGVTEVDIQIEGNVRLNEYGGLKRTTRILHETISLWSASTSGEDGRQTPPPELPFTFHMLGAGGDNASSRLPPSFEVRIGGASTRDANGFNAWVRYTITVRAKGPEKKLLNSHLKLPDPLEQLRGRSLTIPLLFASRVRSPHSALPSYTQLLREPSTYSPLTLPLRNSSKDLEPLHAEVHIARPATYCMRQPIPVCLRLQGGEKLGKFSVRLSMLRKSTQQIAAGSGNEANWMESVDLIGQTMLQQVEYVQSEDKTTWAGEILVKPNIMAGSFAIEGLAVRDFLTIDILPPTAQPRLMLVDSRISIPVTLTTD